MSDAGADRVEGVPPSVPDENRATPAPGTPGDVRFTAHMVNMFRSVTFLMHFLTSTALHREFVPPYAHALACNFITTQYTTFDNIDRINK